MWEFNPEGPRPIQSFLGLTHEEMCKSFFGPQIECPDATEDVGLISNRTAEQVRNPLAKHTAFIHHEVISERSLFDQDWLTKAKMIQCSAPLPEGLENPVLEKMLECAPCPEPSKEDTGGIIWAEAGPHRCQFQPRE